MSQNNLVSMYIRIDAQGRKVPGSGVLRKKMPTIGRWVKDEAYQCCNPSFLLTATPTTEDGTSYTLIIDCDGTDIATFEFTASFATIQELVDSLNTNLSYLGTFSVASNGTDVDLQLKLDIAQTLCGAVDDLGLTLTVAGGTTTTTTTTSTTTTP